MRQGSVYYYKTECFLGKKKLKKTIIKMKTLNKNIYRTCSQKSAQFKTKRSAHYTAAQFALHNIVRIFNIFMK